MNSKEQSELTGKTETDSQIENRLIALGLGWYRGGEIELKWPLGWSINKKAAGWSLTPVGVGAKAN